MTQEGILTRCQMARDLECAYETEKESTENIEFHGERLEFFSLRRHKARCEIDRLSIALGWMEPIKMEVKA